LADGGLTPVEERGGRLFKREDLYVGAGGVNGGKLRACRHLIGRGAAAGAPEVISAASVLSPQNAMAAVVAAELGMRCTVILGGSKPDTAAKHPSVAIALAAGAQVEHVPVGYNPYLQKAAAARLEQTKGGYWLRYGITTPDGASLAELRAFHTVGADQVANLPDQVETLVVPFGSGNSAVGVLYGLAQVRRPARLQRIVLVGIGPDRRGWLHQRLTLLGVAAAAPLEHLDLHGSGYARYGDRMAATVDGIVMHPTYEGKVVRYLDQHNPPWWSRRDGSTCLWIVGGPLPATPRRGRGR
jgi:1-aminocyclopropane-1-carboxylate deaminase/D-cysteine desulfhydrase-like pyridoxal-dependent ACC family enzyme